MIKQTSIILLIIAFVIGWVAYIFTTYRLNQLLDANKYVEDLNVKLSTKVIDQEDEIINLNRQLSNYSKD